MRRDTYEHPLPLEAQGARELVNSLFLSEEFADNAQMRSPLSPLHHIMHSKPNEIGIPLFLATEPVNPSTNHRLVYFRSGQPPVSVPAESHNRFIAVSFQPLDGVPSPVVRSGSSGGGYLTSYGTVLGYSENNTDIIWHDRSERFASTIPLSSILTIHRAHARQCRHCALILLYPDMRQHMETHKKGSGVYYNVFVDDPELGTACGDTGLLQRISIDRALGEGAQGVAHLCRVIPLPVEEGMSAGPSASMFQYTSRHLGRDTQLNQVVTKTMTFTSMAEAQQQYQQSVRFMSVMHHAHLVEYIAVQLRSDASGKPTVRLLMPFYAEGDVSTFLSQYRGSRLEESLVCSIALQLVDALSFLHERNPPIVHGDLKTENVMFYNKKEQIVLMDMEASREVNVQHNAVKTNMGTGEYMAPETAVSERLMPESDMFSLGVFLYVLTVLPDFPMIHNPNTDENNLLNAPEWTTAEDIAGINRYSSVVSPSHRGISDVTSAAQRRRPAISLAECVTANVKRKGFSDELTQVIVELLSHDPRRRPRASALGPRLRDLMTSSLLKN